jgi:IS5 family transposase
MVFHNKTQTENIIKNQKVMILVQITPARRSTYKKLGKRSALYKAKRKIEKAKAQARAKVEHPFRVVKRQFGFVKTRFRGLAKNTAQLVTLFALSNLWMARRHLLTSTGEVCL